MLTPDGCERAFALVALRGDSLVGEEGTSRLGSVSRPEETSTVSVCDALCAAEILCRRLLGDALLSEHVSTGHVLEDTEVWPREPSYA
jgi:hypothetical protein